MRHLRVEVKVGRRSEWCDECYNYVDSEFFVNVSEADGDRFITLCSKHARELAEALVKMCWVDGRTPTRGIRRP